MLNRPPWFLAAGPAAAGVLSPAAHSGNGLRQMGRERSTRLALGPGATSRDADYGSRTRQRCRRQGQGCRQGHGRQGLLSLTVSRQRLSDGVRKQTISFGRCPASLERSIARVRSRREYPLPGRAFAIKSVRPRDLLQCLAGGKTHIIRLGFETNGRTANRWAYVIMAFCCVPLLNPGPLTY